MWWIRLGSFQQALFQATPFLCVGLEGLDPFEEDAQNGAPAARGFRVPSTFVARRRALCAPLGLFQQVHCTVGGWVVQEQRVGIIPGW